MTTNEIRKKFLKFFETKNHTIFKSDSLVPSSDPTLLFTIAGMVQFKNYFLGTQKLKSKYQRASSVQKCFRTSDIEKVGYTKRHLTFFEMPGNFSFGDYFKKEAIEWAWEFLTKECGINAALLYATVYKDDDEAFTIWQKIILKEKIVKLKEDTNFWEMGDTGPCGPCSEIFYDTGIENSCGKPTCGPGCDCDRFIEVWNLVFTQFDKQPDGTLKNLPQKNIDTGMGLERLTAIIQNVNTFFETDEFIKIIDFIENISNNKNDVSTKIIADHCRAITLLISDGILPSNEGRGYVLRRVLRRALTHGRKLNLVKPFLYKICGEVIGIMKQVYPELISHLEYIARVVKMEEEKFLQTLEHGIEILEDLKKTKQKISGKDAFVLYDTYGFPLDLTKELLAESEIFIDEQGFEEEMAKQKTRSKTAWKGSGDKDMGNYYELQKKFGNTVFKGYDETKITTEIVAIVKYGKVVDTAKENDTVEIILKETPFYGESGGQVGDTGKLKIKNEKLKIENEAEIVDTQKPVENLIIHKAKIVKGILKTDDTVEAEIDETRRQNIMRNHTATHLLHKALRKIVGTHIVQRGSLVADDRLRFDFSHPAQLKKEELDLIEKYVNEKVLENLKITTKITTVDDAKKIGAMALFGEKYGEKVRCITIGEESSPESIELCAGTHCKSTGEMGQLIVLSESSIGSGLRRIEAITGISAYNFMKNQRETIDEIAEILKSSRTEIIPKLQKLSDDKKKLEKDVSKMPKIQENDLLKNIKEISNVKLLAVKIETSAIDEMRSISDNLKNKIKSGIVVLGSVIDDKPTIIVSVTKDLTAKFDARNIVKELSKIIGGGGGGRSDMAQAGGKDVSKLDEAIASVEKIIRTKPQMNPR